jgi:uncharacterized membrane protein (DUF2068 family)
MRFWAMRAKESKRDGWVVLIAILKLIKGVLLLAVAIGALKLLHADIAAELEQWIRRMNFDVGNRLIQKLLSSVDGLDAHKMALVSIGTFCYSGLFLTEGTGLLLQKRWAEFLTVIATASFLPWEIYELIRKFDAFRIVLLIVNIAVVVYLIWRLKHEKKGALAPAA